MSRRSIIIGVIVGAVALAALGITWAAGPQGDDISPRARLAELVSGRVQRMAALRNELDLTAEQRTEIRGIVHAHHGELRPLFVEVLAHKRALRDAVLAEQPNEAAIRAQANALGRAIGDAAVAVAQVTGEARVVLTPEQIEAIADAMADNEAAVDRFINEGPAG